MEEPSAEKEFLSLGPGDVVLVYVRQSMASGRISYSLRLPWQKFLSPIEGGMVEVCDFVTSAWLEKHPNLVAFPGDRLSMIAGTPVFMVGDSQDFTQDSAIVYHPDKLC